MKVQKPIITVITEIELLCWKSARDEDDLLIYEFIKGAFVIELEQQIKMETVTIRKINRLKLPDSIIAATALVYKLTLLTRNVEDFKNIGELVSENPWHK